LQYLFGYRSEKSEKTELVILITPTVLTGKRIEEIKSEDLRRLDALDQQTGIPVDYFKP
jgi:type II secretory pathway component GspD/PulD (secretin)